MMGEQNETEKKIKMKKSKRRRSKRKSKSKSSVNGVVVTWNPSKVQLGVRFPLDAHFSLLLLFLLFDFFIFIFFSVLLCSPIIFALSSPDLRRDVILRCVNVVDVLVIGTDSNIGCV